LSESPGQFGRLEAGMPRSFEAAIVIRPSSKSNANHEDSPQGLDIPFTVGSARFLT